VWIKFTFENGGWRSERETLCTTGLEPKPASSSKKREKELEGEDNPKSSRLFLEMHPRGFRVRQGNTTSERKGRARHKPLETPQTRPPRKLGWERKFVCFPAVLLLSDLGRRPGQRSPRTPSYSPLSAGSKTFKRRGVGGKPRARSRISSPRLRGLKKPLR